MDATGAPPAMIGCVAGGISGSVLGLFHERDPSAKFRRAGRFGLIGSAAGYCGSLMLSYIEYLRYSAEMQRKEDEEIRQKRFLEDKDRFGDNAYQMEHRDNTRTWVPAWFPVQPLPDDKYKEMLEEKQKIYNRINKDSTQYPYVFFAESDSLTVYVRYTTCTSSP
jgi:hypothetical protein